MADDEKVLAALAVEPEPSITDGNEPPLSVAEAQQRLVESQVRLRQAHDRARDARGQVARAVAGWQQAIGAIITPEQNVREYIASSIADRAAGDGGRRSGNRPGPSTVDLMAFGRPGIQHGKYGAWRRGALPLAESVRRLNEMTRAAKLPSEQ